MSLGNPEKKTHKSKDFKNNVFISHKFFEKKKNPFKKDV
jgi:hypothetical protein